MSLDYKMNLIFLEESDLDKPVYRIFNFKRLEQIFQEKQLALVKPRMWDDPFENFILNAKGTLQDGTEFDIAFRENFYGQCWSLTKESDAMWRIYSPKKEGVKVQSTIRKLFAPLFDIGGNFKTLDGEIYNPSSFVGKVKYASTKELISMLKDKKRMSSKIFDQSGWGQASTFFFKRVAFKHENEVRLIYNRQSGNSFDTFQFPVDPNDLLDRIVFDPRMDATVYKQYKQQVKDWGYKREIIQSSLYKIRKFNISLAQPE